jgi:sulfate transport system permease protein
VGEFGSVVLISGNLPYKTEVASVYIYNQIQIDDVPGAAAVSVLLLVLSLLILIGLNALNRWGRRHDR